MILYDLNVLLDVLQKREPHYQSSAIVLEQVINEQVSGMIAAHAITTAHYLVSRYQTSKAANKVVDWLIRHFHIATVDREEILRASSLGWSDFEDAVVASAAEANGCQAIVTRNIKDFQNSPVPAMTPQEYLLEFDPSNSRT